MKNLVFLLVIFSSLIFGGCNSVRNWTAMEKMSLDNMEASIITTDTFSDSISESLSTVIFIQTDTLLSLEGYNFIRLESDLIGKIEGIYDSEKSNITMFISETNSLEDLIEIQLFLETAQISAFEKVEESDKQDVKEALSILYDLYDEAENKQQKHEEEIKKEENLKKRI